MQTYLVERDHEPPHLLHERKDLPAHSAQCGDSVADRDGTGSRAFATLWGRQCWPTTDGAQYVGHRCATSAAALYLLAIRPRFGELGLDYADEDRQLAHLRRRTAAAIDR